MPLEQQHGVRYHHIQVGQVTTSTTWGGGSQAATVSTNQTHTGFLCLWDEIMTQWEANDAGRLPQEPIWLETKAATCDGYKRARMLCQIACPFRTR